MAKGLPLDAYEIEEIIRENYDDIYRYCFWKVRSTADAQDITQETFLRFMEYLPRYLNLGKPKALLYTIARNLCINWHMRIRATELDMENLPADESTPDLYEKIDEKLMLQKHIDLLPDEQKEAVLLRYGQELKFDEIAAIMGISRFAVMYRLRNALASLKKSIGKGGKPF